MVACAPRNAFLKTTTEKDESYASVDRFNTSKSIYKSKVNTLKYRMSALTSSPSESGHTKGVICRLPCVAQVGPSYVGYAAAAYV